MTLKLSDEKNDSGFTLIEVLVTLVIIAIGLLGLAGMQVSSLQNQLEAYQRAQAVMLVEEMAKRIQVNAPAARLGEYTAGVQYGQTTQIVCDPNALNTAAYDLCDWNNLLAGQGVKLAGLGTNAGSVNSALGCIENVVGSDFDETRIRVTVAWQGTVATAAPKSLCGKGDYGDDAFRRVAILEAVLADLKDE
ncbi:MAG: type IV pilus modification protein PilV [Halioglobus sp.]